MSGNQKVKMKLPKKMKLTRKLAVIALSALAAVAVEAGDAALEELSAFALTPPAVHALPDVPERYLPANEKFVMNNGAAVTAKGRVWVSWVGGEDNAEAYTLAAFSDDGGRTWTNPALVIDGHVPGAKAPRSNIIGNFWMDPQGVLHLFFSQGCWHNDGRMGVWEIACANPDDARPRWTAPRRLSDGAPLNKPIIAKDGTWLLPVEIPHPLWKGHTFRPVGEPPVATLLASRDRGATWEMRGRAGIPDCHWPENHLVEKHDGTLQMYMRTLKGMRLCESSDQGRSWGPVKKPAGLDHPVARFQMRRLKSGNWLFIRHEGPIDSTARYSSDSDRNGIYAYLSKDEGRSWKGPLIVDHCPAVSYPDVAEDGAGRLYVTHDYERAQGAEIRLHVFREADVEAGRIVSPDARLGTIVTRATGSKFNREHRFNLAVPVWPEGRENERCGFFGFRTDFDWTPGSTTTVRVAASTYYRVWLNGKFLGTGPVRAAHGFFRVDEWPVGALARPGRNALAVEVSNYNEWSQSIPSRQPGFLQCEVSDGRNVLAATGRDFTWLDLPRLRSVGRFSRQRGSCEVYRIGPDWDAWRTNVSAHGETPARHPLVRLQSRGNSYPEFKPVDAKLALDTVFDFDEAKPRNVRCRIDSGFWCDPYAKREWTKVDFDNWDEFSRATNARTTPRTAKGPAEVSLGKGVIADFGCVQAGFLCLDVECDGPAFLYAVTDDVLTGGIPDPVVRFTHATGIAWDLTAAGRYRLQAFEPWAMRYVHLFARKGTVRVRSVSLLEYVNAAPAAATFECSDDVLNRSFAAAQKTCAMHTMDATLDCATRERNSGPNDSLYTTGAYRLLSGKDDVERLFFENFAVADAYPDVPEPLVASFYPADPPTFPSGALVNYSLWFILELERYVRETGDKRLREAFRKRVTDVLDFYRAHLNADGLYEHDPKTGKIFFEWSGAARFAYGVHYPTSMLLAETIDAVARLYGQEELKVEADRIRAAVRRLSWDGRWFRDHSVRRPDGTLETPRDISETCQYFAFRFGIATPATHPDLWKRLVEGFGRGRTMDGLAAADLFTGVLLRYDCLARAGLHAKALEGIRELDDMVRSTGTYWEKLPGEYGYSCEQGFMSFVANFLVRSAVGLGNIDYAAKRVRFAVPDNGLDFCRVSLPTPEGTIRCEWSRKDGKVSERLDLPAGWRRETTLSSVDAAHAPETRRFQGIPSVAVSQKSGRLWCTWYAGPTPREDENNYCVLATSTDGGDTWREVLVADPDGQGGSRAFDPEVWIAPDGRLRWTWTERVGSGAADPRNDGLWSVALDAEKDPEPPFSAPRRILKGVMMCKPTVLSTGEWMYPLCEWQSATSSVFHVTADGERFVRRGGASLPKELRQFDEEQVVEKRNGDLVAFIRTGRGLVLSSSKDRGVTWSKPAARTNLVNCATRLFVRKLRSGNWLLVKNGARIDASPRRVDLTAYLSRDDGETWEGGLVLDRSAESTYPDGDQGPDGVIHVVYDHDRTGERDVRLASFTESDVLKGTGAIRRTVICVPTLAERRRMENDPAGLVGLRPRMIYFPEIGSRYSPADERFVRDETNAVTRAGNTWKAWTGGGEGADAYVLAARLSKRERRWQNPMLVLDGHLSGFAVPISVSSPRLRTAADGALHLTFVQKVETNGLPSRVWETVCRNPDDYFPVWSEPEPAGSPAQ